MCTALDDDGQRRALALALVTGCWERGEDISDEAALARLADGIGLDGAGLLASAGSADVKRRLAQTTAQAVADGVFGVPTFRVDGDAGVFWGGDRVEALFWQLRGGRIDELALDAFLAREPLAQRRR